MSQLLLETPGHQWCCVPTENPRHRQPCLGAFIFGVPVILGVFVDMCGRAPVVVFRACGGVQARWDATASSSMGKCEDDEDGSGIPPSSSRARTSSKYRQDKVANQPPRPGCKQTCRRGSPPSHFILFFAFATLLIFASGVAFGVAGMDVSVVAFAFQLAGVDVVAAMFAGGVCNRVCLPCDL
jgi:hypothetical protein